MGFGATVAVEHGEEEYRQNLAVEVAATAAPLVASRDCSREDAIDIAVRAVRARQEAEEDGTGTLVTMLKEPQPRKKKSAKQVAAVAEALLPLAEEAVEAEMF